MSFSTYKICGFLLATVDVLKSKNIRFCTYMSIVNLSYGLGSTRSGYIYKYMYIQSGGGHMEFRERAEESPRRLWFGSSGCGDTKHHHACPTLFFIIFLFLFGFLLYHFRVFFCIFMSSYNHRIYNPHFFPYNTCFTNFYSYFISLTSFVYY